eukprot:GFYU01002009.1.p1 GENE.GFYU01002009.1~~GFYU01002009.1.p1  ORF type:complete len:554 (-),score=136.92 GFYU01002009.1:158-1819(-)
MGACNLTRLREIHSEYSDMGSKSKKSKAKVSSEKDAHNNTSNMAATSGGDSVKTGQKPKATAVPSKGSELTHRRPNQEKKKQQQQQQYNKQLDAVKQSDVDSPASGNRSNTDYSATDEAQGSPYLQRRTRPRKESDTRRHWQQRTSRLDTMSNESAIFQSEFSGFFNLAIMWVIMVCFCYVTDNLYTAGRLMDFDMLWVLVSNLHAIALFVTLLIGFSFSAVPLQQLLLMGLNVTYVRIAQHTLQSLMFVASIRVIYEFDWGVTQTAALIIETIVLFMKMHSYTEINIKLHAKRKEMLKEEPDRPELTSRSSRHYPNNISYRNFFFFLLVPTLVYNPSYPRLTGRIRAAYIIEKILSTIGILVCMYAIVSKFLRPVFRESPNMSPVHAIVVLILPVLCLYMLTFFLVFEAICNGFAEITRFADREFYRDWWNSTNWDEFSRLWNRPVHQFLLVHIYQEGVKTWKVSKFTASLATFLFSALLHELILACIFRMVRPWLLGIMMFQLPLIAMGKMLQGTRAGNMFFWFGMCVGPPMISILYAREWYSMQYAAGTM